MARLGMLLVDRANEAGRELVLFHPPGLVEPLLGDADRLVQGIAALAERALVATERAEVVIRADELERSASAVLLRFSVSDFGRHAAGLADQPAIERLAIGLDSATLSRSGDDIECTLRLRFAPQLLPTTQAPSKLLQGLQVLVIDDNAVARQAVLEMARALGARAESAVDGWDGWRAVAMACEAGHPFDMALVDADMPGMDGLACIGKLGSGTPTACRIVLMAARRDHPALWSRINASAAPVGSLLAKPVLPRTLEEALLAAVRATGRVSPGNASAAPTLDRAPTPALRRADDLPVVLPFVLPFATIASTASALPTTPLAHGAGENSAPLRNMRLILVEDNVLDREIAIDALQQAGAVVALASDGDQVLRLLETQGFDGVLLSCELPALASYQMTRAIRQQSAWSDMPVIGMGFDASTDRMAVSAGMTAVITKPLDSKAARLLVGRWLRPRGLSFSSSPSRGTPAPLPLPDALASLPGIDARIGMASTMGNERLFRRLLSIFRDKHEQFVVDAPAALDRGDIADARRLAHDMRGLAGTLGALAVQEAAASFETACVSGQSRPALVGLYQQLEARLIPVALGLQAIESGVS